jgi:hypothetical protein
MTGRAHGLADQAATVSGWFLPDRSRYFSASLDSAPFEDHLAAVELDPFPLTDEGVHPLRASTLVGELDPAVSVARWLGPDRPSLVLHHGNNERPFDLGRTAKNTLGKAVLLPEPPPVNVLVLRAPFHAGSLRQYLQEIRSLDRFVAMLATSVGLMDALVDRLHAAGSDRVVLAGLSLGGWAVNLHRAHRGTADAYVPIFAGAALAAVFLDTPYRRLTSRRARRDPDRLRSTLNFEERFERVATPDVFPLLARYDRYIDLERQRSCYGTTPVAVIEKGHVTGGLDATALRAHVEGHLEACRALGPAGTEA